METDCILHKGQVSQNGYGRLSNGKDYAHRNAWEIFNKSTIPKGMVIKHKCDNKLCINPFHLELGTQAENVKEAYDRGLRKPTRKLTDEQIKEIKSRIDENNSALAREFGVSRQLICDISKGRLHGNI